jgi:hypothetical protein
MSETNCMGMDEMIPSKYQFTNEKVKTHEKTFYFAHSTGERKKIIEKSREQFKEPKKIIDNLCGFNINVT